MSTSYNDQWVLLGTRAAHKPRRGRVSDRGAPQPGSLTPEHDSPGERPKLIPERPFGRRHKRPRWIDRDT